jgi:cytochrome oxidase Cu insertion factor (SCO1/SenC/PrrC family)
MRSRSVPCLFLLLVPVVFGACQQGRSAEEGPTNAPIMVGDVAPDFTLPAASGGEVSLSDYRGSPVLLYFSMGPG